MDKKIAVVLVGGERKKALNKVLGEVAWVELRIDLFLQKFSEEKLYCWVKEIRKTTKGKIIGTVRWHKEQPECCLSFPRFFVIPVAEPVPADCKQGAGIQNVCHCEERSDLACPCRSEAGVAILSEEKRKKIYKEIIPFVDFVDVEVKSKIAEEIINFTHSKGKKVILSYHNFTKTPSLKKLKVIYQNAKKLKCDILKIATKVNSPEELLLLLNFSSSFLDNKRISAIITPMSVSVMERLMPLYFGSLFTYVSLTKSTAPGQPSYAEIKKLTGIKV